MNRYSADNLNNIKDSQIIQNRGEIIARSLQLKRSSQVDKHKARAIYEGKIF